MRYVSIDIETTGLNPSIHQILEFSAIIEDTTQDVPINALPSFTRFIYNELVRGDVYALSMNSDILQHISRINMSVSSRKNVVLYPNELGSEFKQFLADNNIHSVGPVVKILVAGKNFATFDKLFLDQCPDFNKHVQFYSRMLDPAILFARKSDRMPPSLDECLSRAGVRHVVNHRAYDDAVAVIQCIRYALK